jgi:dolichyl-phosphate beta-glucosyltransferase
MNAEAPTISLILPAYNEVAVVETTLSEAIAYFRGRRWTYQIIVAADGADGTRESARRFAAGDPCVQVIGEPTRRGKGRGIREAMRLAAGEIVGFADVDNKVPIGEFDKLEPALREGYDVVIGSRGLPDSRIERRQPWYRRLGARGFYHFMHLVVGMPGIEDTQCGFKFFPRSVAKDLFARQQIDGYMFDVEILALAQRLGYRIKEVPIRWRDDPDSRLALIGGNLRNVVDLFKIRATCARMAREPQPVRAQCGHSL